MWVEINGRWKSQNICIESFREKQENLSTYFKNVPLAFEMAKTSDQLFTQQHRSAFPSKIEIYEMKQKKSVPR
jgi:hypothetical protein